MLVYGKCECFVMHMLYVCVLCHPVAVLNAAFCMACSLTVFGETIGNMFWCGCYFVVECYGSV